MKSIPEVLHEGPLLEVQGGEECISPYRRIFPC